ncbi:hypothetical protein B0H11DRAFT_1928612 [Mycena galericulata]|nr:hypothetical protein B0H11DRAFT_1928612 [Mycena galericulata]
MAQVAFTIFSLFICLLVLYPLTPSILETYPQAGAFVVPIVWITEKSIQGVAVACLIGAFVPLYMLLHDAYGWLTGRATAASTNASATPTPADLENGSAPRLADLATLEAEAAAGVPPAPEVPSRVRRNLYWALSSVSFISSFFIYLFISRNVVSPDKPLLENVGATGLFILGGLEVDFVFLLLGAVVGYCVRRGRRAATTAPVLPTAGSATTAEVVFDKAASVTEEEKEYKDVVAEEKV